MTAIIVSFLLKDDYFTWIEIYLTTFNVKCINAPHLYCLGTTIKGGLGGRGPGVYMRQWLFLTSDIIYILIESLPEDIFDRSRLTDRC